MVENSTGISGFAFTLGTCCLLIVTASSPSFSSGVCSNEPGGPDCLLFLMSGKQVFKKIPQSRLAVSEPDPRWFGNVGNEKLANWSNGNWLKSRFHFSFAEYHNPANTQFGVLRVMNDDLVQPKRGFGQHGHGDMEIITYVVHGHLTHKDSMGTAETLTPGSIQFMTAGTGVQHSEKNEKDSPLRFVQTWITPRKRGLKPNYGSFMGSDKSFEKMKNSWFHMCSDVEDKSTKTPVEVNQDINLFAATIDNGTSLDINIKEKRQAYVLMIDGKVTVKTAGGADGELEKHDGAEVLSNASLTLKAVADNTHIIYFEMAYDPRNCGRMDF